MKQDIVCESVNTYEVLEHIMGIKGLHPHRLSTVDAMRKKIADHVSGCDVLKQGIILDIGCGTGHGTRVLAKMLGEKIPVIGLDINRIAIENAHTQHGDMENLSFHHGNLQSFLITYPDCKISGAICISVSMFVPDVHEFYRQIHAALIPGGMFIDAPFTFSDSTCDVPDNIKTRTYAACGCNMKMFKSSQLKNALETSGFQKIEHFNHKFDLMDLRILFKDYPPRYLLGNFIKNILTPPSHFGAISSSYLAKRTMSIFSFFMTHRKLYAGGELIAIKNLTTVS